MNVTSTISTWTDIINHFLPIFTVPGGKIFVRLLNGWILCTVRRTITGILPFADPTGQHAHDAFHRFFPDGCWNMARLWQILAQINMRLHRKNQASLMQKNNKRYFIVHPWNPLKSTPSFADALTCLRRELWRDRIKCMFGVWAVHDKNFEFLIETLAKAA